MLFISFNHPAARARLQSLPLTNTQGIKKIHNISSIDESYAIGTRLSDWLVER